MQEIVIKYFDAWKNQDTSGLLTLFTNNSKYIVHPYGIEEYSGIEAIKSYWIDKPVNNQINPNPRIINQAYGDNIAFVEWETMFEKHDGSKKSVRGILVLEFENGLIKELREHYDSVDQ